MNAKIRTALLALLLLCISTARAEIIRNVAYGDDRAQKMDIYLPEHTAQAPVILMVHGGAWRIGDKNNSRVIKNKIAYWLPRGFIFISMNYRMLPARDALQQRDDIIAALIYAQHHAHEWGGDPAQFFLMGHSAGAHLVALVNADPEMALHAGAQRWLGTIALDSGALDVPSIMQRKHYRFYDQAFGDDPARWRAASPLQQLQRGIPPLLAVCSLERADDSCGQSRKFAEAARALGNRVDILPQQLTHGEVNEGLGLPGAYTDTVQRFMTEMLHDRSAAAN